MRDQQQKTALAASLRDHLSRQPGTQAVKAEALGISQPRLSDLMRDRLERFSLDALVSLAEKAGLRLNVAAQTVLLGQLEGPRFENLRGESPFPVDPSELGRLDSHAAPKLFLRILRCEVLGVGLSPKDVVLSHDTTSADGGIDAKVDGAPSPRGLLSKGNTHFQIKTGASFKPWQPSKLKHELFGSSRCKPSRDALAPAVRRCLDDGGTYSLIVFGHDLLPDQHSKGIENLTRMFRACGYENPKVSVIGQGQLAGEIEQYPSIYLDLFGFDEDNFFSIRSWKEQTLMRTEMALGQLQQELIANIRETIADNSAAHVRLVGEPGIGKTRLALEALSHRDIAPTVVYVPTGEDFQRSRLFKELIRSERKYPLTIVVDDCDEQDRASIWGSLRGKPSVKLLTIDHGIERTSDSGMRVFECPRLDNVQIEEILGSYIDAQNESRKWAEICDGSPRVAHAVGENLKENPDDILRPPSTVPIWDRYISGYAKADSTTAEEYRTVLRHIALFAKFGFEAPVSDEGRFVAELVSDVNPSITYPRFQSIVQHFRERRILQGRHTLFLVPKALHIHLWVDFWNNYGRSFDFSEFYQRLPDAMSDWFLRLFAYAHESSPALAVVKTIAGTDGPFADEDFADSEVAARFLRYLAEADRWATLNCIERTYGRWNHGQLLAWRTGRQDIVWALEKIAVWEDTFEPAVRILTRMALAENAQHSNNSKGIITDLFSIGLGWAATQAPPEKRFPILRELVRSKDEGLRSLGMDLAKSWLSTYGGSRIVGAEHQGLRPTLVFWRPNTHGDVYEAWRNVWHLLDSELEGAEGRRLTEVADVLIGSAEGLLQISELEQQVVDTLFKLARIEALDQRTIVALVIRLLKGRYDQLPSHVTSRIRELDQLLTGSTLWDRISRYILHSNWEEDYRSDSGNLVESSEPQTWVSQISRELMESQDKFTAVAQRLLRVSGHRLYSLGFACGQLAGDDSWDSLLVALTEDSEEEANAEFLGGYLAGVRENDETRWETVVLRLFERPKVHRLATASVNASGLSDNIVERMRALYVSGDLDSSAFARFAFRIDGSSISANALTALVDSLLDKPARRSGAVSVALLDAFYIDRTSGSLPRHLTLRALVAAAAEPEDRDQMAPYYWGRVAEAYVEQFPTEAPQILKAFLNSPNLISLYNSRESGVALHIIKAYPKEAWEVIAGLLESEDRLRYDLVFWLNGEKGLRNDMSGDLSPAAHLPTEQVIAWIHEDPDRRAGNILGMLPKTLDSAGGGALTARFVEEFAARREIAGRLMAHFWSGSWSGPESQYLERKRHTARKWLAETKSPAVDTWLTEFITNLSADIESARIREEREF